MVTAAQFADSIGFMFLDDKLMTLQHLAIRFMLDAHPEATNAEIIKYLAVEGFTVTLPQVRIVRH